MNEAVTFGALHLVHLAWAVPLLILLFVLASKSRAQALAALVLEAPDGLTRRRAVRSVVTVVGLCLLVIAALQPRWGFTWREYQSQGIEVVYLLDLSNSMDAEDVLPSRLERARRDIEDLSLGLGGSRQGLVIFAGGAYPRVPLTSDRAALMTVVGDSDTGTLRAQGSALTEGLGVALQLLDDGREGEAAIIVLSDGEAWDEGLSPVLSQANEQNVRVYGIGVGTDEGAPIPLEAGGFKTWRGEVVVSRLQADTLKRVAAETGGAYIESSAGAADTDLLALELMATLESQSSEVRREKVWDERYQLPLAGGLACLFLAAAMGDGRRFALLLALLAAGTAEAAPMDDAYELMDAGRHEEAVDVLTELQIDDPNDPFVQTALAESLYLTGRYDESARAWEDVAARSDDPLLKQQARYNAGHARYQQGQLERSAEHFEASGEVPGGKENGEQVRQELARRRAIQEEQQEPQDGEPQDGEPQDGEPQDGEPQDGEPQDGEPQDGEPQDGEPQDGEPQGGEPQQGEGAPGEQGEQPDGAEPQVGDNHDGTRPENADEGEEGPVQGLSDGGDASEPGQEGEDEGTAVSGSGTDGEPAMSEDEARKLLDSIEEGEPRVVIRGESQGKDW